VLLAALAVRLVWLVVWEREGYTARYGYDAYVTIAQHWHGWMQVGSDTTHPPLYAFWAYLVFGVVGRPALLAVQVGNVLLGSLSCLLVGLWAERVVSRPAGRLAGLWAAFDPLLIFFSVQLQSEPFFVALELAFFIALLRAGDPPSSPAAFGLGLLGGIVSLARSVFGLFAPFACASLILPSWRRARSWLWLLMIAGWAAAPSIWGVRNLARHGVFIPFAANGGWNLWEGFTLDRAEVRRRPHEMAEEISRSGIPAQDAAAVGEYFARKTKRFVLDHPLAAARIVAGKFLLYWRPLPYDPHGPAARALMGCYFSVLFLLAAAGALSLAHVPAVRPVFALFIYLSLLHSVFFTSLRYRTPLEPFLCVFAAAGLLRLLRALKR